MRTPTALLLCPALPHCLPGRALMQGGNVLHVGGNQPDPVPSSAPIHSFQWLLHFLLFGGLGCGGFLTHTSHLILLHCYFLEKLYVLSIKPNLTRALPIAVVVRAEVSSLCKRGREDNSERSKAAGMVQYQRSCACHALLFPGMKVRKQEPWFCPSGVH